MDTNNYFSFQRIAMVMKREVMENWKKNLYAFIGIYAASLLVMLVQMANVSDTYGDELSYGNYCLGYVRAFTLIIIFLGFVYASFIMDNMQSKEQRISFLMLPATMLEKFVARALCVTVGLVAAVCVAISLAELTRLMLLPLFDLPEMYQKTVLPDVLSMAFADSVMVHVEGWNQPVLEELFGCSLLLWWHSLYILGGNYWYKKSFFKTLGFILLVLFLAAFILVHVMDWMGQDRVMAMQEWLQAQKRWLTLPRLLAFWTAFFSVFTLLNWWLSYKLFTRAQVVKPKFRLL